MNFEKSKKKLTSRQVKALETKNNLYQSAMSLFKEKGYYNVSVDEIVAKAGTSKGSFYTYFKSKDQVMKEHSKRYDGNYVEFYQKLNKSLSASEKLLAFVENMYNISTNEAGFELIYVIYQTQLTPNNYNTFMLDDSRALYTILKEIIETGQKSGEFRDDISSEELVRLASRTMRGTYYDWCLYNGNFDLVEEGSKYFSIFLKGIKNNSDQ